jgi:hypothetical protein
LYRGSEHFMYTYLRISFGVMSFKKLWLEHKYEHIVDMHKDRHTDTHTQNEKKWHRYGTIVKISLRKNDGKNKNSK